MFLKFQRGDWQKQQQQQALHPRKKHTYFKTFQRAFSHP